jgi:hypothetical protein
MQNQKIQKIALIAITALLIPFGTPAEAEAPHKPIELTLTAEQIALQNPKKYAQDQFDKFNWTDEQMSCLGKLWGKESGWNHLADNPHSTAFGIAQMLGEDSLLVSVQIDRGLRYVEHRYGSPCMAWQFWQRNKWY